MITQLDSFIALGIIINDYVNNQETKYSELISKSVQKAGTDNPWFTEPNIMHMFSSIVNMLNEENLQKWLSKYHSITANRKPRDIGVIMAGNIPLVGFHDMLCVLVSGHKFIGKYSSKDKELINLVVSILLDINPDLRDVIYLTEDKLPEFDAVVATGSNNSSRYFEYYFGKKPNIIRKNRNSIAIIDENTSDDDLQKLASDIFTYFGLGCRNVSKIFVPHNFDFQRLFSSMSAFQDWIFHNKYANNYNYHKTIYLLNKLSFLDNDFLLLKEDSSMYSPVANLFYSYYSDRKEIDNYILSEQGNIQCVVADNIYPFNTVLFGESQNPNLWDYSDNIDTLEFLLNL